MYGELEILRMVAELRHEELIATAGKQRWLKQQQASQPDKTATSWSLANWIGIQLVTLGCHLLVQQPGLLPQSPRMGKCIGC